MLVITVIQLLVPLSAPILDGPAVSGKEQWALREQIGTTGRSLVEMGGTNVCINEVYPDPDRDLNGDNITDQMDEFIELYNPSNRPLNVTGMRLSDDQGSFVLGPWTIGPGGFLALFRTDTKLVLSSDEIITLRYPNDSVADVLDYPNLKKGWVFQRSPDGGPRARTGRHPTPEGPNPVPHLVINEVMADPTGANTGNQWVELRNNGGVEELKDMVLTNNEQVSHIFPSFELEREERVLIALGKMASLPPSPSSVRTLEASLSDALYSTGDDLELHDRNGASLDYVAWGASKHVEGPKGVLMGPGWDGKVWDTVTGAMSVSGAANPTAPSGRSLSRQPDGCDTDSVLDITAHAGLLGSSPGWPNGIDPTLSFSSELSELQVEKGSTTGMELTIIPSLNMSGELTVNVSLSNSNWTLLSPSVLTSFIDIGHPLSLEVEVLAPTDLSKGNHCTFWLTASWGSWEFLPSIYTVELVIPAPELFFKDLYCTFEGFPATLVPEGAFLDVGGKLFGGGELPTPEVVVQASIYNSTRGRDDPSTVVLSQTFFDIRTTSRKTFSFIMDTLGLEGGTTITLFIDPQGYVEEPDEENNIVHWELTVVPAPSFQGQGSVRMTEVLWNATQSGCFVRLENAGPTTAEISGSIIGSEARYASFPGDCWLAPLETVYVIWGSDAEGRVPAGSSVFRLDGKGPSSGRMTLHSSLPELKTGGLLWLKTRWRIPVDEVLLHGRGPESAGCVRMGEGPVETTYGSILKRVRSSNGDPIDTNTTLDWTVPPLKASLKAVLVSPRPGGSGEYVTLEGHGAGNDISGASLVCRGRVAVVPNGTLTGRTGLLAVSREPDLFMTVQGVPPDLTTGYDTTSAAETLKGCRVPGYEELLLPNDEAELLLLDRGNRVLDRLVWGEGRSGTIGKAPYDTVIWRSSSESPSQMSWKALCKGSEPAHSLLGRTMPSGSLVLTADVNELTPRLPEGKPVHIHAHDLQEGPLFDLALKLLEGGREVTLRMGGRPWDAAAMSEVQAFDAASGSRACFGFVKAGGRVFIPPDGKVPDRFTPFLTSGNITVLLYGMDRPRYSGPYTDLPMVIIGLKGTSGRLPDLAAMAVDEGYLDVTSLISSLKDQVIVAGSEIVPDITRTGVTVMDDVLCTLRNGLDHLGNTNDGELWYLHNGGPLDVGPLLEAARNGAVVRLMIGPREVHPSPPSKSGPNATDPGTGSGALDMDLLESAVLERAVQAVKSAELEGVRLEAGVLPADRGFTHWSGIQVGPGSVQLELPSASGGNAASLRLTLNDTSLWDGLLQDLWSHCGPLPEGMGWNRPHTIITDAPSMVRIEEVYADTYLVDDPDEYIALRNVGGLPVDISGWTLSDDEGGGLSSDGTVMLPEGSVIGPEEMFFIARDHMRFLQQNGHAPDIALFNCTSDRVALLCQGDLRLSNKGDSLHLRDARGTVVDSLCYGATETSFDGGAFYTTGLWDGPPAPLSGWGYVLHRERRTYLGIDPDTNTGRDWMGIRPRVVGQSRFGPFSSCEVSKVRTGYCPDSSSELLSSLISNTGSTLDVNVYELTSEWIASAMVGAAERGVHVRVMLEGSPVGGRTYTSVLRADELLRGGVEVRYMVTDTTKGVRDRYSYDHAKYIVSDGRAVLVSSDNFKDTSFPPPLLMGSSSGTRGWVMLLWSSPLAEQLGSVFEEDWGGPDMVDARSVIGDIEMEDVAPIADGLEIARGLHVFGPSDVEGDMQATLLISPDHLSVEGNPLLEAIAGAKDEVLVEALSMDLEFISYGTNASRVREPSGPAIPGVRWPNPYLATLLGAAMRGVKVRVLLDGSDFNGDSVPDNRPRVDALNEAASILGASANFSAKLHPQERADHMRKVSMVHNKGMVIDGSMVWVSSFNLGPTSALKNREVGVLLSSEVASDRFRSVFMYDWGSTLLLGDPVRSLQYGPAGPGRTMGAVLELTLDEHLITTTEYELVVTDAAIFGQSGPSGPYVGSVIIHDGLDGSVTMTLHDLDMTKTRTLDLYMRSEERWTHLMRFDVEPFQKGRSMEGPPWYSSDIVPLLGVVAAAIILSGSLELLSVRSRRGRLGERSEEEE